MKEPLAALALVVAVLGCAGPSMRDNELVIRRVTLIDGTGAPPQSNRTLVIHGPRIADILDDASFVPGRSAVVVDGNGKFVIPGLWDMHGHLTDAGEGALVQLIENGVTGVRDMGGDLELVKRYSSEIEQGKRIGPYIVAAGPLLDGPTEAKWHVVANDEAEARELVRSIKARGADFVKIHTNLPREAFFAAVDEAKQQGIQVAVHLPKGVTMAEASDAGVSSLEHDEMLLAGELQRNDDPAKSFDEAFERVGGEQGAALFRKLAENHTWYVPTMIAYERGFVLWSNKPEAMMKRRPIHWRMIDLVGAMHEAGVKVMAGSDFSDWALVPGVDLHNELALMVEAGFSPMEVLQAATALPAEFLGKSAVFGTLERGKAADLVLLDGDPLESISNTRKIHAVVLEGRYLPIRDLREKMLSR